MIEQLQPVIPLEAAREYVRRGWRVVPIPFKRKGATIDAWKQMALTEADLPKLAAMAAKQWTAQFNPRPVTESDFVELFRAAL